MGSLSSCACLTHWPSLRKEWTAESTTPTQAGRARGSLQHGGRAHHSIARLERARCQKSFTSSFVPTRSQTKRSPSHFPNKRRPCIGAVRLSDYLQLGGSSRCKPLRRTAHAVHGMNT